VLAKDLKPISSTRIHAGTIDRDGNRLAPIRVRVGTMNPVKLRGVQAAFERLTGCEVLVEGADVASGVPEQPTDVETVLGAEQRALSAWGDCDYSVGVEAGLQRDEQGLWFDVQAAVVYDGETLTRGYGPAFQYPEFVTKQALAGEMISDIVGPLAGDEDLGGTTGAIGFLTKGAYQRDEFTAQAVLMALVPRVRRELYLRTE
ncbi:MAG: inosine/xanthosine triphosphatase, partial [Thermoplasmatota archaeon]